eukprot:TRINITY_DN6313_c0_g1_i1.p1 TRINITY_DN6313_c0_g1~~TRINITY_DN6313_c0_g1_i1.p1  ORF type:complete len:291 (+),score=44.13 TRINITY_DN6313_c0_g1_i1:12-884(+)
MMRQAMMRSNLGVVLLLSVVVLGCVAVEQLSNSNFDNLLRGEAYLVEFYAPWCSHCKVLEPTLSGLEATLQQESSKVKVGLVDCSKERALCKRFAITEFPTLIYFNKGFQYSISTGEPRTVANLLDFVTNRFQTTPRVKIPAVNTVQVPPGGSGTIIRSKENVWQLTTENIDELLNKKYKKSAWFIKFFTTWCGHCKTLEPIFYDFADVVAAREGADTFQVGQVDCDKQRPICDAFGIERFPVIKAVYKNRTFTYSGERTKDKLVSFVDELLEHYNQAPSTEVPQLTFSQ